MDRVHFSWVLLACMVAMSSCMHSAQDKAVKSDSTPLRDIKEGVLVSDEQLRSEGEYDSRGDEFFEDFLYAYLQDSVFRLRRTMPALEETMADGTVRHVDARELDTDFMFMHGEYTTDIYTIDSERRLDEDTALVQASVERIDLEGRNIVSFDFVKSSGVWNLHAVREVDFAKSDLGDFLNFYSVFASDMTFREQSISPSVHISMMDPDGNGQTLDGFINREQWYSIGSAIPEGVISNIRCGQDYGNMKRIFVEKTGLGNGMSETFIFEKRRQGWKLVGYEN